MKKLIILLLTIVTNLYSQNLIINELFGVPPNELAHDDQEYSINDSTSIDSINFQLDSLKNYYNENCRRHNPFANITFVKLDENQIDSIIQRITLKDHIVSVGFIDCPIKRLPGSVKDFINLYFLGFRYCDSISSLNGFNSVNSIFYIGFDECRISKLPEGIDKIKSMLRLELDFPNDFKGIDLNKELAKFSKRHNIIDLYVKYKLLEEFPESLFNLTSLQTLIFFSNDSIKYPDKFDKLVNLINAFITTKDEKAIGSIHKIDNISTFGGELFEDDRECYDLQKLGLMQRKKLMIYHDTTNEIVKAYLLLAREKDTGVVVYKYNEHLVTIDRHDGKGILTFSVNDNNIENNIKLLVLDDEKEPIYKLIFQNNEATLDINKYRNRNYYIKLYINDKIIIWHVIS